jgi:hypothetical protein
VFDLVMSLVTVLFIGLAAMGAGALVLSAARLAEDFSPAEKISLSFVFGFGILGWVGFFLALGGFLSPLALALSCALFLCGLIWLRPAFAGLSLPAFDAWGWALLGLIAVALAGDLMEGLSPPADADSLAYHFANPKLFLTTGAIEFIPRAVDGAIPMLQQMTYLLALGLGGETSLTLWAMLTGWAAAALIYVLARRHLCVNWSLATALIFLTTPAVIYAGGGGQVETRSALFVLAAALMVSMALKTNLLRYAFLAGIAAGFFVASKYTGLVFAGACGLVLLGQRRWFAQASVFSLAVLIAGSQWYFWNWWNTGDPVFPMLYGLLDYRATAPWNAAQNAFYTQVLLPLDRAVPANLWWLFLYPFKATLNPAEAFESLRVGLGPYVLLLLPFAAIGLWKRRRHVLQSPLMVYGGICLIFYTVWFLFGPSQRVRHFLPLYPLLIIAITIASVRAIQAFRVLRTPIILAAISVVALQIAGHGLFSLNYAKHVLGQESRNDFLVRNINAYEAVTWINNHLSKDDKVMTTYREHGYLLDIPYFYPPGATQSVINLLPDATDVALFSKQLLQQNITHVFRTMPDEGTRPTGGADFLVQAALDRECLELVKTFNTPRIASRTLQKLNHQITTWGLFRIVIHSCQGTKPNR